MLNKNKTERLLDVWNRPDDAGDPIGLIATTFTFEPDFFEEDCLGRFLHIQSDPDSDGPIYLIELEEKLGSLECASILIDQHHCRGIRNIRWDMIPARAKKGGILHSKISILAWSQNIRIIIASANITKNGYRTNQEISGVLDFNKKSTLPLDSLLSILEFVRSELAETVIGELRPDILRAQRFLNRLESMGRLWLINELADKSNEISVYPLLIKPGGQNVFEQLKELWKNKARGIPNEAMITSPFFNPPEDKINNPARLIWDLLVQRGKAKVIYNVCADSPIQTNDKLLVRAPKSLADATPVTRQDTHTEFRLIRELITNEKEEFYRSIHLKSICIYNNDWLAYMIGSSNFTSAGLGLSNTSNFEANLVYFVSAKNQKSYKELRDTVLNGEKIKNSIEFLNQSIINEDETGTDDYINLPDFFISLILAKEHDFKLILQFGTNPPEDFEILEENGTLLINQQSWILSGKPSEVTINWINKPVPAGMIVKWKNSNGTAYWPVILSSSNILPPPDEIKDLPLEILIQIITSARPMHQIIKSWLTRKKQNGDNHNNFEIVDPHKRVDTSEFLLQRTRKISFALSGLKNKLEMPAYTVESIHWRLFGPIGVKAVVNAIMKEAKSDEERAFLLCEIALELSRINYRENENSLKASDVKQKIQLLIEELYKDIQPYYKIIRNEIKDYIKKGFKVALT